MFMRFQGGGVGHKVTREWDEFLRNDGAVPSDEEEVIQLEELQKDDMPLVDEAMDDDDSDGSAPEDLDDDGSEENEYWVDEELDDGLLAREGYGAL
jgi:hypothetical protein